MTTMHPCHVCGALVEAFAGRVATYPCCSKCFAPIRTPVEPTVERGDLLVLHMYGDPTVASQHDRLHSASEALACWAPEPRTLDAYAELLRALDLNDFMRRSSSWPQPRFEWDKPAREAVIERITRDWSSGLFRWRIDEMIRTVAQANEAELRHHRHVLQEAPP